MKESILLFLEKACVTSPSRLLVTAQSRREKYVIARECELARGSSYRKAHLRARGDDRYGDNVKEHRLLDHFPILYITQWSARQYPRYPTTPRKMVEYGKTLGAIPHFLSCYNILEKITSIQDKAIASRDAFTYRENIVFQFSKHDICYRKVQSKSNKQRRL